MTKTEKWQIIDYWLASKLDYCTCDTPDPMVHRPECGYEPVVDLTTVPGFMESKIIREVKAEVLREFADSIRTTEVLFHRNDGSEVKVTLPISQLLVDLLRETAARIERE